MKPDERAAGITCSDVIGFRSPSKLLAPKLDRALDPTLRAGADAKSETVSEPGEHVKFHISA